MGIVVLLVLCSLIVSGGFLLAFLWATRTGQYDDMATPAIRMIYDETSATHRSRSDKEHHGYDDTL